MKYVSRSKKTGAVSVEPAPRQVVSQPTMTSSSKEQRAIERRVQDMMDYRQHLANVRAAKGKAKKKYIERRAGVVRDGEFYWLNTEFINNPLTAPLPNVDTLFGFYKDTRKPRKKR